MTTESVDLSGQVALVTGGGQGLGRAFAQALALAGAAVAVTARSEDRIAETVKLIEEKDGKAVAIAGDVIEQRDVERIVATTEDSLGSIDILVNNAGIAGGLGKVWELEPAQWWRALEVNLQGTLLFSHTVLKGMTARKQEHKCET